MAVTPASTFDDLAVVLHDLAAALNELVLGDLEGGADVKAVQTVFLAADEVLRAADDLAVRTRSFLTDAILRSPSVARP